MPDRQALIDLSTLGDAATALVNRISDAIGVAYAPTNIRRMARAEAESNRIRALAEDDLSDELLRRAKLRSEARELMRQRNLDAVVVEAASLMPPGARPETIGVDWLNSFIDHCERVSDEQMQSLWARLLAAEATKKGSFRRQTLNIVATLERYDAERFTSLGRYVWGMRGGFNAVMFTDSQGHLFNSQDLTHGFLRNLESLGLIAFTPGRTMTLQLPPQPMPVHYFDRTYLVGHVYDYDEPAPSLQLGNVELTAAGQQLFRICGAKPDLTARESAVSRWRAAGINVVCESE